MIVIDASCLLELLLQSSKSRVVEDRLQLDDGPLSAPHLIDIEIAHVLRRYLIVGDLSEKHGRDAVDDLADFPLERYPHTLLLPRIWQLHDNLTAYDASYVALAESLDAPLITCDKKLARSSGHDATIEIL